jgi:RNA polymerase sigma-70 factor (ECF subfamily)
MPRGGRDRFETTEWSLVLAARDRASPHAEDALARLCQRYWYPVYAYVRRQGCDSDQSLDLTQGFFTRLLEKDYLRQVDRERGRFRAFLLAACRHFLSNERDRERALKRGGRARIVSIDAAAAEDRLAIEPSHELTPEREFMRRWALTVVHEVLRSLRAELAGRNERLFDVAKPWLVGEVDAESFAQAATELGSTEGAVRVAVHRLRRRFRERLMEEVARTVEDPDEAEEELRSLLAAL